MDEPDPFDDERWSFPRAAAWIIWRSRERVAQLLLDLTEREGRVQVFDIFNETVRRENGRGNPPEGGVLPFVEAQSQLWERLKQGRLVAMGVKVGEATWSHIPASEWFNLDYFPCTDGRSNSIGSNHSAVYDEVTVGRSAVLEIWPDIANIEGGPKRGRRPKIDPDYIKEVMFDLLDENGDISGVDMAWRTKADVRLATEARLQKKFGKTNVPRSSQMKKYVKIYYEAWLAAKATNE